MRCAPLLLVSFTVFSQETMKQVYVKTRKEWRDWLSQHHDTNTGIWLVFYKKHARKPSLEYDAMVEEALCFGWIDSTTKRINDKKFAQKFSPRNPKSSYSQANKERLRILIKKKKIIKEVLDSLGNILDEKFIIPKDILKELKANKKVWKNFQKFPEAYQRIRIGFVDGSRNRPDFFRRRLDYLIKMTEKNKKFGFGIDQFIE